MMKYSFYNHLGSSPHSYLIYKSELSHVYKYESNIFASLKYIKRVNDAGKWTESYNYWVNKKC